MEWHKDAEECLLSDTEIGEIQPKYYLSKRACRDTQKGKKEKQGTAENSCNGSRASSEGLDLPKLSPTLTNSGTGLTRPWP